MAEKNNSASRSPGAIDTLVGVGMRIEGKVACAGVLRLQGEILGDIVCSDKEGHKGFLVVDGSGQVAGSLDAPHIAVRGKVAGPMHSALTVEVYEGGSIEGDVSFSRLAVHPGGIINGLLSPSGEAQVDATAPQPAPQLPLSAMDLPELSASRAKPYRRLRFAAAAGVALCVIVAAIWAGRSPLTEEKTPADKAALKAEAYMREVPPPGTARVGETKPAPAEAGAAPVVQPPSKTEAFPAPATEDASREQGKTVTVRGANPSRPAGVFLLVSNQATVLYRKKQGDPGDGLRFPVAQGEKISVSITPDELIRVAKGTDVIIFFQGQKVPASVIESGAWIRFEPK